MTPAQPALTPLSRPSYAGLGARIGAHLLDLGIAFSVVVVVGMTMRILRAVGLWTAATQGVSPEDMWAALGVGAKLLIIFAYAISMGAIYRVLFEASAWQASFGKRLLNIYVTDDNGQRISITRSLGRWLARFFVGAFGGSLASVITIAATENRKSLHDYIAKTVVVKGRPALAGTLELWRIAAAFILPFAWILGTFLLTM